MPPSKVTIGEGDLDDVITLASKIPEFVNPYSRADYLKRLKETSRHLILIAKLEGQLIGFKLGYAIDSNVFYSWFGGVLPGYRNIGAASHLARYQEDWALKNGYKKVRVKTRNSFTPMLLFAIKSGFQVIEIEKKENISETRILLEKTL